MGIDMWFKDDIGNVLEALNLATARMGLDYADGGVEFQEGYTAALRAVAVSFGIRNLPGLQIDERRSPRLRMIDQLLDQQQTPRRLTSGR
jgi:hypothetical protein